MSIFLSINNVLFIEEECKGAFYGNAKIELDIE